MNGIAGLFDTYYLTVWYLPSNWHLKIVAEKTPDVPFSLYHILK